MKCDRSERIEELLQSYSLGEVSAEERRQVEDHLADCSRCRDRLFYLQRVNRIVAAWPTVPDSMLATLPSIDAGVRRRIREPRRSFPFGIGVWSLAGTTAAALLVGLIVLALIVTLPRMQEATPAGPKPSPSSVQDLLAEARAKPRPTSGRAHFDITIKGQERASSFDILISIDTEWSGQSARSTQAIQGVPSADILLRGGVPERQEAISIDGKTYVNSGNGWRLSTSAEPSFIGLIPEMPTVAQLLDEFSPSNIKLAGNRRVQGVECDVISFTLDSDKLAGLTSLFQYASESPQFANSLVLSGFEGEIALDSDHNLRELVLKTQGQSADTPTGWGNLTYTLTVVDIDSPTIVIRTPHGAVTPTPTAAASSVPAVDTRAFVEQMREAPKPEIRSIRSRREVQLASSAGGQFTTSAITIDSELAGNDVRCVVETRGLASSDDPRSITEAIIKGDTTYQKNTLGQWTAVPGRGKSSVETLAGLNAFNGIPDLLVSAPTLSYGGQREVKGVTCEVFGLAMEGPIPPDILATVGSDVDGRGYFTDKTVTSIAGEVAVAAHDKTIRQARFKVTSASTAHPEERFDYVFIYTFWDLNDPNIAIEAPDMDGGATPLATDDGRATLQALLDNPRPAITSLRVIREDTTIFTLGGQPTITSRTIEAEANAGQAHWKHVLHDPSPTRSSVDWEVIADGDTYYTRELRDGAQWQVSPQASTGGYDPRAVLRAASPIEVLLLLSSSIHYAGRRDYDGVTCDVIAFASGAVMPRDVLDVPASSLSDEEFFGDKTIERVDAEVAIAAVDLTLRRARFTITGHRTTNPSDCFERTIVFTFRDYNDPNIIIGVPVVGGGKPTPTPRPMNTPSAATATP
ncbi:MAG: zf-HC2 domain-containing protein [Chloroflexota bacterium]